ncbi:hypothetical protein K9L97_03750 [Candidatus Woesearchaeota archaeon]|nr:hypothetical protein [Candidatus Woesearchaeota archaeon]
MTFITQIQGIIFLIGFGVVMILLTYFFSKKNSMNHREGFLVANRKVGWFKGGTSIAASWIWAGALFVSIQMSYQNGLAGIFWFTMPNIFALILFAFWAPKIREKFPKGYTLPQWIKEKFKDTKLHKLYLIPFFFNQILAIAFNVFAGGTMISLLTGIPLLVVIPILIGIALIYTLISGLEASMITDMVQMGLIVVGIFLIVPWAVSSAGGLSAVAGGLGGLTGQFTNIFNPAIMFSLGLINSIGLISGTIADQQYWQRTFALKKKQITKAFVFGGILFAVVPIMLSLLGFMGANPALGITLPAGTDPSLIGIISVTNLVPKGIAAIFILIMIAGLSSTIDSGISAFSSLWITDVSKKKSEKALLRSGRLAMFGAGVIGLLIAYGAHFIQGIGLQHLWFLSISIVASISVPTILTLYLDRINPKSMFYGILIAIVIGMPFFFYANIANILWLQAVASVFMVVASTSVTLLFPKRHLQ